MVRNTATDRRRHSAVTARPWAEVTGEAATLRNFPHLNLRVPRSMHDPGQSPEGSRNCCYAVNDSLGLEDA
jgi:hypothetical protein